MMSYITGAKMSAGKLGRKKTRTMEYQVANDPNRFRLTRQTTFGRRHMNSCTETSIPSMDEMLCQAIL
ncbi:hypothetical protein M0R45_029415 [Rubus argutus]|uniref:Uncharacterized protein n=1 Tax=Rubus argutus TaxID=59490 RepID=A0AAW1W8X7_RUBAR